MSLILMKFGENPLLRARPASQCEAQHEKRAQKRADRISHEDDLVRQAGGAAHDLQDVGRAPRQKQEAGAISNGLPHAAPRAQRNQCNRFAVSD